MTRSSARPRSYRVPAQRISSRRSDVGPFHRLRSTTQRGVPVLHADVLKWIVAERRTATAAVESRRPREVGTPVLKARALEGRAESVEVLLERAFGFAHEHALLVGAPVLAGLVVEAVAEYGIVVGRMERRTEAFLGLLGVRGGGERQNHEEAGGGRQREMFGR